MNGGGCKGCSAKQMSIHDWLSDIPESLQTTDMVEVQFKNTRKGYYLNSEKLDLSKGDIVAVESSPGHDIGEVTLTGKLVELAIKKNRWRPERGEVQRIYRIARPGDIERWEESKRLEEPTMIQSRQIAADLGLEMKIGDVEYQGDGNKAIFYYIADGRVDFRQLIRVLASTFHVRIEMKQIGARQEAGLIGGIGPCGRELCCASWMKSFVSVNTNAARLQDLSLNAQKLTGMCGKLKCCMNYEVNAYAEAQKSLPSREVVLETKKGAYYHFKTDNFQRLITYSTSSRFPEGLITVSARRVFEVIAMNNAGTKPDSLDYDDEKKKPSTKPLDILEDNSLTRFDKKLGKPKRTNGRNGDEASNGRKRRPEGSVRSTHRDGARTNGNTSETSTPNGERQTLSDRPQGERQPRGERNGNRPRGRAPREGRPRGSNDGSSSSSPA